MRLAPAINSWLSLFFSVLMFRPLCDHIVYALYKVNVLHIRLNELSALLDTVFGMLLFLYGLFETLFYFIANRVANLLDGWQPLNKRSE